MKHVLAGLLFLWPLAALAQTAERDDVERARTALRSDAKFPWYDAPKDDLQRLDVRPPTEDTQRQSKWLSEGDNTSAKPPTTNLSGGWLSNLVNILGWTLLGGLLVLLIAALIRAYLNREVRESKEGGKTAKTTRVTTDAQRIESLPFQLDRPQGNLLDEARRQYELGNYGRAIVYLFSYRLLELDKHHLVRLSKGKTNRQYLRELPRRSPVAGILETTMIAFEDFFFGHHELERVRFEECWQRNDEFEHLLNVHAEQTAT